MPAASRPRSEQRCASLFPVLVAEFELLRHLWFPVARLQDLAAGPVGAAILGTELVVYLGAPFTIHAGIRALSENFRDMSHFAFVHRKSMGPNLRREVDEYRVEKTGWTLRYTLSSHPEGLGADDERAVGTARPGQTFADVAYGRTNTYNVVLPSSTYIVSAFPGGGRRMVAQFAVPHAADGETTRVVRMVRLDDEVRSRHGVTIKEA